MRAWKDQSKEKRKGEEEMMEYEAVQFRLKGIRPRKARLKMAEKERERKRDGRTQF